MSNLVKEYLEFSELDFLGPFCNLWIGFNSWYQDLHPNQGDQEGCLSMSSEFRQVLDEQLGELEHIDQFFAKEIDSLSFCQYGDYTTQTDVSGIKFKLRCENRNLVTEFLQAASKHPRMQGHTQGLRFFEPIGKPDPLFQSLYQKYRQWEASSEGIVYSSDAARISTNLAKIGVEHYGHMLFHNFKSPVDNSLYSLDDVYGSDRGRLLTAIGISKRKDVVKRFGTSSLELDAWDLREKAPDITSLYLYVLYKFRCEHFHGNLDPRVRDNQNLAKTAFLSLRGLMDTILN
ncbi:MAG: hypothetical protein HOP17_17785 [Acidobacteria bacterium]|nr:hypothetical protein [Acidobacteriota bacterium]